MPADIAWITLDPTTPIIETPGFYRLGGDQTAGGIAIRADDVTLDLGGHAVIGNRDPGTLSSGIEIAAGLRNIAISNGRVEGYLYGVRVDDGTTKSSDIRMERLIVSDCTFRGIGAWAERTTIVGCQIRSIGGTTAFFDDAFAMGIELVGDGGVIADNKVAEVYPRGSGEGVGIASSLYDTPHCHIVGNVVRNSKLPPHGRTFGLWVANRSHIRDNVLINQTYGMAHPDFRDASNTSGNMIVGEQCSQGYFSTSRLGLDTIFLGLAGQPPCLDCLDVAMRLADPADRHSLFRIALIHEAYRDFAEAAVYFEQAAALGSMEASRKIRTFLASGELTEDQFNAARSRLEADRGRLALSSSRVRCGPERH